MELEKLHTAYALRNELSKYNYSQGTPSSPESKNNEDAVIIDLKSDTSDVELFKHIEDHYSGKGYLSKETGRKLNREVSNSFSKLATEDPNSSALYSGYLTAGISYGAKARFVNNINHTLKSSANIRKAYSGS